jgi:hypothetical protein
MNNIDQLLRTLESMQFDKEVCVSLAEDLCEIILKHGEFEQRERAHLAIINVENQGRKK